MRFPLSVPVEKPTLCSMHSVVPKELGLPINQHINIRDLTAALMDEVSTSTEIEPSLQPLTG